MFGSRRPIFCDDTLQANDGIANINDCSVNNLQCQDGLCVDSTTENEPSNENTSEDTSEDTSEEDDDMVEFVPDKPNEDSQGNLRKKCGDSPSFSPILVHQRRRRFLE